jgi:hypothetical protein
VSTRDGAKSNGGVCCGTKGGRDRGNMIGCNGAQELRTVVEIMLPQMHGEPGVPSGELATRELFARISCNVVPWSCCAGLTEP